MCERHRQCSFSPCHSKECNGTTNGFRVPRGKHTFDFGMCKPDCGGMNVCTIHEKVKKKKGEKLFFFTLNTDTYSFISVVDF